MLIARHRYGMWICTAYMVVYIVFLAALTGFVVSKTSLKVRHFGWKGTRMPSPILFCESSWFLDENAQSLE